MTVNDFSALIFNPNMVQAAHEGDLKEIVDFYPYFSHARILYLKSLQQSGNLLFESHIASTSLYASDRESLFFYLYPDKKLSKAPSEFQREERFTGSYFDLLEMAEGAGGEQPISLKKIAEQLKASRKSLMVEPKDEVAEKSEAMKSAEKPKVEQPAKDRYEEEIGLLGEVDSGAEVSSSEKIKKEKVAPKKVEFKQPVKPHIPVPDYFKEEDPLEKMSLEEKSKWYIQQKKYPEAIQILKQLYLINPKKSIYFADQIRFLEKITSKTT